MPTYSPDETFENTPDWWSSRAATVGASSLAVCMSEPSQLARFEWIASMLDLDADDVVLDWGCGTAAFSEYVPVAYVGYDWSEVMRHRARKEHPGIVILDEAPRTPYEHVVCSGPFNLSGNWSKYETFEVLHQLWALTKKSLIVSLYAGDEAPEMLSYDAAELVDLVRRLGSPQFELTSRHLPHDLIVGCWR